MKINNISNEEIAIWENFVEFVNKCRTEKIACNSTRRINIKYVYIGVEYDAVEFKYLINDSNIIGIEFFAPEHPESTLSHRLINRVNSVSSAIKYMSELSQSKN